MSRTLNWREKAEKLIKAKEEQFAARNAAKKYQYAPGQIIFASTSLSNKPAEQTPTSEEIPEEPLTETSDQQKA